MEISRGFTRRVYAGIVCWESTSQFSDVMMTLDKVLNTRRASKDSHVDGQLSHKWRGRGDSVEYRV